MKQKDIPNLLKYVEEMTSGRKKKSHGVRKWFSTVAT